MNNSTVDPISSPDSSSSAPSSAERSPTSPVLAAISVVVSGAVSITLGLPVARALPQLAMAGEWVKVGCALTALAVITAPATAIPLLGSLARRFLPSDNNGGSK